MQSQSARFTGHTQLTVSAVLFGHRSHQAFQRREQTRHKWSTSLSTKKINRHLLQLLRSLLAHAPTKIPTKRKRCENYASPNIVRAQVAHATSRWIWCFPAHKLGHAFSLMQFLFKAAKSMPRSPAPPDEMWPHWPKLVPSAPSELKQLAWAKNAPATDYSVHNHTRKPSHSCHGDPSFNPLNLSEWSEKWRSLRK